MRYKGFRLTVATALLGFLVAALTITTTPARASSCTISISSATAAHNGTSMTVNGSNLYSCSWFVNGGSPSNPTGNWYNYLSAYVPVAGETDYYWYNSAEANAGTNCTDTKCTVTGAPAGWYCADWARNNACPADPTWALVSLPTGTTWGNKLQFYSNQIPASMTNPDSDGAISCHASHSFDGSNIANFSESFTSCP